MSALAVKTSSPATAGATASYVKVCTVCRTSRHESDFYWGGQVCRKCDPRNAGTWFLSYLAELGYIRNNDFIDNGWIDGTTQRDFLGLPAKTMVHIRIDDCDKTLFHLYYLPGEHTDEDDDDGEDDGVSEEPTSFSDDEGDDTAWWDRPSAKKMDFRFDIVSGLKIVAQ
jgi:hypothetical protein